MAPCNFRLFFFAVTKLCLTSSSNRRCENANAFGCVDVPLNVQIPGTITADGMTIKWDLLIDRENIEIGHDICAFLRNIPLLEAEDEAVVGMCADALNKVRSYANELKTKTAEKRTLREERSSSCEPSAFISDFIATEARQLESVYTHAMIEQYRPPPLLYPFVSFLARRHQLESVIDFSGGCGHGAKQMSAAFNVLGVVSLEALECARSFHGDVVEWFALDFSNPSKESLDTLFRWAKEHSAIVSIDVLDRVTHPSKLLQIVSALLEISAPVALLSTSVFPHGRWSFDDIKSLLQCYDLPLSAHGLALKSIDPQRSSEIASLAIVARPIQPRTSPIIRVLAIVSTFNEIDFVDFSLDHLVSEGCDIYVIDNWSNDGTYERIAQKKRSALSIVGLERFPEEYDELSASVFDLALNNMRKAEICLASSHDWCMHYDLDEIRLSPWPELTLLEAIKKVEVEGYNVVDFTVIEFLPTAEQPSPLSRQNYSHWHMGSSQQSDTAYPAHLFLQEKLWRNMDNIHRDHGGHIIMNAWKRVYPFKFIIQHYPFRSIYDVFDKHQTRVQRKFFARVSPHIMTAAIPSSIVLQQDLFSPEDRKRKFVEQLSGLEVNRTVHVASQCGASSGWDQIRLALCSAPLSHYFNCDAYPFLSKTKYQRFQFQPDGQQSFVSGFFHIGETSEAAFGHVKHHTLLTEATKKAVLQRIESSLEDELAFVLKSAPSEVWRCFPHIASSATLLQSRFGSGIPK